MSERGGTYNTGDSEALPPVIERHLEQRLGEMDDVIAERCLAILDAADVVFRQQNERIDRIALQIDRNALALDRLTNRIDQLTEQVNRVDTQVEQLVINANADRAVMLEILQYLRSQYPGNGKG